MFIVLLGLIFLAAFIDAIAGGGALIALPAYYAFGIPPHAALGTNKFAASTGTLFAVGRFMKSGSIRWKIALTASVLAIFGSTIGARMALLLDERYLQYLMLLAVPLIAVVVLRKKDLDAPQEQHLTKKQELLLTVGIGLVIGWYDGFFGPAAGTFYTLAFTTVLHMKTTDACGTTKVVNFASGVGALATFVMNGKIDFKIAIPCAAAAVLGNWIGSGLAIKNGAKIVRPILLATMSLLLVKVAVDLFL